MNRPKSIFRRAAEGGITLGAIFVCIFLLETTAGALSWLLALGLMVYVPVFVYRKLRNTYLAAHGLMSFSGLWLEGMRLEIAGSRHPHIHEMACAGLSAGGRGASDTIYRKQSADGRRLGIARTDSIIFFLDTAYRHFDDTHVGVIVHRKHRVARHSGTGEDPVRAAATFLKFINL